MRLIDQPSFTCYLFARVSSALAFQMQAVAVGWQGYALTGSTFYLGLIGLAQFLPMFCLTLIVGHVVDRYDRARIACVCQIVEGLAALLLALGSATSWLHPASLLGLLVIVGASRAFEMPSMQALVPGLVPALQVPQAMAWATSAWQTATIIGPALGGLLYVFGPGVVYAVVCLLFIAAALLMTGIRLSQKPTIREPLSVASVFAGLAFIRQQPVVLGSISLDLFAVLLGGATALLPVYARDILHIGPWGLGLMRTAPSVGALVMSVVLARRPLRRRVGRIMLLSVAAFGAATIAFGISTSFWLSLGALAVLGAADVISVVIRNSLVQLRTRDAMRGRVTAVHTLFIGTSNQLGEFESGVTAALFGTVPAVVLGGLGTLVVVGLWARLFPELRRVDTLEEEAAVTSR